LATTVFLHGHGGWKPSMGFVEVPKGCSVSFYTHFAKLLNQTMVLQILNGTYTGEFDRTVPAFHSAPNVQISSLTPALVKWAKDNNTSGTTMVLMPASPPVVRMSLEKVMDLAIKAIGPDLDFRWLCCQALQLKKAGGGELGVNASDRTAQAGHEGEYLLKWVENGVEKTRWVKSSSSIHH
jgi:hypothetical protein